MPLGHSQRHACPLLILAVALAWVPGTPLHAQALKPRSSIVETYRSGREIPVGGAEFTGAMFAAASTISPDSLRVFLPANGGGVLCLEIRSRDGRYHGAAEYDIAGVAAGSHLVAWASRYAAALRNYTPDDLAILTSAGSTCMPGAPRTYALASWATAAAAGSEATFFFNAATADVLTLSTRDGRQPRGCSPVITAAGTGGRIAYNRRCTFPVVPGGRYDLRLTTRHFDSRSILDFLVSLP